MNIDLSSKIALVGASTQGLGFATAVCLANCGANVFLMARNKEKLINAVAKLPITSEGQKHGYLVADFSDYLSFKKIIEDFFSRNEIDILINNTNGPRATSALDAELSDYESAFNTLFKTVVETTMLAIPQMINKGRGRIINVSSSSIVEPINNLVLSNAIRSATAAWAKTLANEVGQYDITVNNILTGNFDTERIEQLISNQASTTGISNEKIRAERMDKIPMKRMGRPEEFGYLVSFLASDLASYITGTDIPIDGGLLKSR
ncbi:SDR family oxidoreductase [Pedobacter mucosus]|uniref:SDR family oxidoreductase n=1 Tax=Pedobacter mucosus TaxID=2895286 RepID=UPI001EE491C0|nr:SDR family oxidoreductase [Pedobacter mucosus]UKT65993.1 SDR family oxidoreductase [Pedobacter mucosus]